MKIEVVRDILDANAQCAAENAALFRRLGLVAVNVMASPGAGKTSLIISTIKALDIPVAVIEGDIASTVDAQAVAAEQVPVVEINTGGACHLDAAMVRQALARLQVQGARFLFIENVGNLVCPVEFPLGEQVRVLVASVPEGDDKPLKYPGIFSAVQAVVLNKTDLLPHVDFDLSRYRSLVRGVNPQVPVFEVSCRTGHGLDVWLHWLRDLAA
ncbi:MAG: hydrogenase nickel incorporation protein HypB [Candidatus Latescibacterota bacterium]|jgi:hydrogenase nickel incorporation protein HypB